MGRTNIVSNGIPLYPLAASIEHRRELLVDDTRTASGLLRRVSRGAKETISYAHDNLSETELTQWLSAHPTTVSYIHIDELNVTRTVVTDAIEYAANYNMSSTERRYTISVTVREV